MQIRNYFRFALTTLLVLISTSSFAASDCVSDQTIAARNPFDGERQLVSSMSVIEHDGPDPHAPLPPIRIVCFGTSALHEAAIFVYTTSLKVGATQTELDRTIKARVMPLFFASDTFVKDRMGSPLYKYLLAYKAPIVRGKDSMDWKDECASHLMHAYACRLEFFFGWTGNESNAQVVSIRAAGGSVFVRDGIVHVALLVHTKLFDTKSGQRVMATSLQLTDYAQSVQKFMSDPPPRVTR